MLPVLFSCKCNNMLVGVVDYDLNEGLVTVGNVAQRVHLYLTVRHTTRSKLLLLLNSVT